MSDIFDGFDGFEFDLDTDLGIDLDMNGIPDVHEGSFLSTDGDAVPDVIDGHIDRDLDTVPDQDDAVVDADGNFVDDGTWVDADGDFSNDWEDPFVDSNSDGLSDHAVLREQLRIAHFNPFYSR